MCPSAIPGLLLAPLLLLAGLTHAERTAAEEEALPPAAGVVKAAIEAHAARDRGALKQIAESNEHDPWHVAHELCLRGELAAARALGTSTRRRDLSPLKRYIGLLARRRPPPIPSWHQRLQAYALGSEEKWSELVALVQASPPDLSRRDLGAIDTVRMSAAALFHLGRRQDALDAFLRAGPAAEKIGWWVGAVKAYEGCFETAYSLRDFQQMIDCKQQLFSIFGRMGRRGDAGRALADLGSVYGELADYPQAIEHFQPVLDEYAEALPPESRTVIRVNLGLAFLKMGQYAEAELALHRARQSMTDFSEADPALAADLDTFAASILGMLRTELGEFDPAETLLQGVLAHHEAQADQAAQATAFGALAELAEARGDLDDALGQYGASLALFNKLSLPAHAARARLGIASVNRKQGKLKAALQELTQILANTEELNDAAALCMLHGELALVYRALGDPARALTHRTENLQLAREAASVRLEVQALAQMARLHLDQKNYDDALDRARDAEGVIGMIFDRLAPGQAARARDSVADTYDVGLAAAVLRIEGTKKPEPGRETEKAKTERLKQLGEVFFWMEGGRAGALLVALEGRASIREVAIDADLQAVEDKARTDEAIATRRYLDTKDRGSRKEVTAAKKHLEATRLALKVAIERIQLEEGMAADLLYPSARDMKEIQGLLGEGEALVLYGSFGEEAQTATAFILDRHDARIVSLGPQDAIDKTCARVREVMTSEGEQGAAKTLRGQVSDPLDLGKGVKRVLLSPAGALSYQPPALLFPDREVVCVPSGSAYARLIEAPKSIGGDVLAIADPVYGAAPERWKNCPSVRGGKLIPLPGTRVEAKAITNLHLLGAEATEEGLRRALQKARKEGKHFRALHIACHGLVDDERPGLTALALTPTDANDGMLTVLDISQLQIPADLVVLSACESGLGKMYRAEGISSLSRAFMVAGAPRVMVSLWKVDDDATRALMTKFYERWNAKDPKARVSAPVALREAQAHVRNHPDHPEWSHPAYWAAWQLWGPAE